MWFYNNESVENIPEGMVGFVYCITNLSNNKKYIGKKNFYFSLRALYSTPVENLLRIIGKTCMKHTLKHMTAGHILFTSQQNFHRLGKIN